MQRRTALGLIGAAAATPFAGIPAARARSLNLDPAKPADTLLITRKLAHTMDTGIAYWWAKLSRMGMVDKVATPLWDVHVAALLTTRDVDDRGAYETTVISLVFYTDIRTGDFLQRFTNPYTGREVEINYFPPRPTRRIYSVDGPGTPPPERPGYEVIDSHPLGPAVIQANDVWVRVDDITRMEPLKPDVGPVFRVNDWSTYHGALSDVADPDVLNAPATWHFNDILSWPPYLEMGDHPGDFMSRGFGRKVGAFSEMPAPLQALIRERHPAVYRDPAGALQG